MRGMAESSVMVPENQEQASTSGFCSHVQAHAAGKPGGLLRSLLGLRGTSDLLAVCSDLLAVCSDLLAVCCCCAGGCGCVPAHVLPPGGL